MARKDDDVVRAIVNGKTNSSSASKTRKFEDEVVKRTPWTAWIWLLPVITLVPYYFSRLHYSLPEPLPPFDASGRPQPSEANVLAHIQALEDAGYRVVGTQEALRGEEYVVEQVQKLETQCNAGGVLDCEVWLQKGNGNHEFNIMEHDVLKMYAGVLNVIMRISAKSPPSGKKVDDALLLGSHIDSTLPAPGAADDGMGVGVMLELARVLIDRNEAFDGNVLFLWNGAEETLQDGSHMFSTQHHTAKTVRAVINLEAAGTTGGSLLFQATSKEMIEAYSHAPHPRGTTIAAEVFSSGIIISDTDFVQFEKYLNVSGLDLAIVGHSYFYHTRKDSIEHIQRGSAQHFATDVMAVVDFLTSPASPLLSPEPWHAPDIVYFSLFDRIWISYSMDTADKLYVALAAVIAAWSITRMYGQRRVFAISLFGAPIGFIGSLLTANIVAATMGLIDRRQTWFAHEHMCILLFTPIAAATHLGVQYLLSWSLPVKEKVHLEKAHYFAQMAYCTLYMLLLQNYDIRSAYLFAVLSGTLLLGTIGFSISSNPSIALFGGYVIPMIPLSAFAVEGITAALDIFTPLTGRMGKTAPAEHIIATISTTCTLGLLPVMIPLFFRIAPVNQRRVMLLLTSFSLGVMTLFASPFWMPYDPMHPQRIGLEYTFNHTSGDHTMHIGFMDKGPRGTFVNDIHKRYGSGEPVEHTSITEYDSDWDIMYPVSSFMDTYRFQLPKVEFDWPMLDWGVKETLLGAGRKIDLRFNFRGFVWPTLAFDADIEDWSFDFAPPNATKRHHIKIATSADDGIVDLHLTLRNRDPIKLYWSAIDGTQLVPHTASRLGANKPAGKLLLDLDTWVDETYNGSVDVVMGGIVTGILDI